MIFFLSSSCRFVEVWRRERDDQISKLSLPFSSSTSSARASEPLEIKCLCIHYSLVSVRIWWWYWWWWKWSEWIDRSREGQKGQPAKEEKETSFFFPSFFIFFGNDVSFDHQQTDTEFRGKEEEFFFRKVSLSFSFSFSLSSRSWITTCTHHINSLFLIIIIK